MADIKIYGKLVANTEDQVVADVSSIQDTARNQKLNITLENKLTAIRVPSSVTLYDLIFNYGKAPEVTVGGGEYKNKAMIILVEGADDQYYNGYYSVYFSSIKKAGAGETQENCNTAFLIAKLATSSKYYRNGTLKQSVTFLSVLTNPSVSETNVSQGELYNFILPDYVPYSGLNPLLEEKQDKLVDGINIKTVNGQSLLGEGDLVIQGGGTVEAEPIVSIKMTNLDLRPADDSSSTELDNVQLYCTKETWNNMVAYAKQLDSSIDINYTNFGTIYATLSTRIQGALVGFLMMDYLNGKVLPNSYTEIPLSVTGSTANIQRFLNLTNTFQGEDTNNAKIILGASFGGSGSASYFPSLDRTSVPYTTSNTVITVEEIEGASIGSSSGSGTSDVLYKHTITGLVAEPDTPDADPEQVTLTFLSKYANSFASNSSLADFGTNILHTNDANAIISPMIVGNSGGINVTVYPIVANGSLSQIRIFFPYSTSGNFYYQITASRNTSGITDIVEPYIQVSGGSGSSASDDRLPTPTSNDAGKEIYATEDGKYAFADVFHFVVADFENINVYFVNSPAFEAQAITAINTMIDSTNSQYGTSIPNISGFNEIYGLFSYLKSNNLTAIFKTFYATLFTYVSTLGVKTIYSALLPVNGQVTLLNTSSVNNMLIAGDMVFWYQSYNTTTEQLELHKSIPLTTDGLAEVDYNGIRTLLS